jgi:transposase-like protein
LFKRSTKSADPLSDLYLDGLEQGDFDHAIQALIGDPEPLGDASIARLGNRWRGEHAAWKSTPIDREVVYLWADGVRLCAGVERPETAVLVVVASHADGSRSVVASESGDPSSKDDWLAILRSLGQRGMNVPRLVVGPGSSGLWAGIDELGWDCARQYCWSHETDELLASLPKKRRSQADKLLRAASAAETRADAKKLRDRFVKRCGVRCADTGERLAVDWKQLTSFYAFPEDHWAHLRTTQVIEAPLAAIRLQATEAKPGRPSPFVEAVLWKLLSAAARSLKKLSAAQPSTPATSPVLEPEGRSSGRSRRRSG